MTAALLGWVCYTLAVITIIAQDVQILQLTGEFVWYKFAIDGVMLVFALINVGLNIKT